jgi:phosphoenolpyruvate carboxylase
MRVAGLENAAEWLNKQLEKEISDMTLEDAVPLARAFSHYLNLTGIAETHHRLNNMPFFFLSIQKFTLLFFSDDLI